VCLYCFNDRQSGWLYRQLLEEMKTKKTFVSVERPNQFDTVFHIFFLSQVLRWRSSSKLQLTLSSRHKSIYSKTNRIIFTCYEDLKSTYQSEFLVSCFKRLIFLNFNIFIFILIASEGRAGETWEASKMSLFLPRLIKYKLVQIWPGLICV